MNFLAHVFLSGKDPDLLTGNFIADYVKGNKKNAYPARIREGIELHRGIDDFIDHHPVALRSRHRLQPAHGKYAGVVVDLVYDHYLARYFREFSDVSLDRFAEETYSTLEARWDVLPDPVRGFLPYMVKHNWLLNYATTEGIGRALSGLSRRVSFANRMDEAVADLERDYSDYETDFREFFPAVMEFSAGKRASFRHLYPGKPPSEG